MLWAAFSSDEESCDSSIDTSSMLQKQRDAKEAPSALQLAQDAIEQGDFAALAQRVESMVTASSEKQALLQRASLDQEVGVFLKDLNTLSARDKQTLLGAAASSDLMDMYSGLPDVQKRILLTQLKEANFDTAMTAKGARPDWHWPSSSDSNAEYLELTPNKKKRNAASLFAGPQSMCSDRTGETCTTKACTDRNLGDVMCVAEGARKFCNCQSGFCANGAGRCDVEVRSVKLNGTFTIQSAKDSMYLYMEKYSRTTFAGGFEQANIVSTQAAMPGPAGKFHIVVNNDGTIMLNPDQWEGDEWVVVQSDVSHCSASSTVCNAKYITRLTSPKAQLFTPKWLSWRVLRPSNNGFAEDETYKGSLALYGGGPLKDRFFLTEAQAASKDDLVIFDPPLEPALRLAGVVVRIEDFPFANSNFVR